MTYFIVGFVLFLAVMFVYNMLSRETGFKLTKTADGKSRFGSIPDFGGLLGHIPGSDFLKEQWAKKDDDSKKLFLYILTIIIAYAVGHMAPEGKDVIYRGAAALIVLHFIWTFSPGKASKFTWTIVVGMLVYFVLAWAYPNDAPKILNASWGLSKKVMASVANGADSLNENYGKSTPERTLPVATPSVYQSNERVIEVLATEDKFTEVKIPSGVKFSIDCPDDGLAKVYHRDAPQGIIYDCAQNVEVGENLHNFRVGFSSKTDKPVLVRVRITS